MGCFELLQVYLCGNSVQAKQAVEEMATKLGFAALDRGSLSAAGELEDFPLQLFPEWRLPLRVAVGLIAFFFFYLLMRDVVYKYVEQGKDISFRIMVSLANKVKTVWCVNLCLSLKVTFSGAGCSHSNHFCINPSFRCFPLCLSSCWLCVTCLVS